MKIFCGLLTATLVLFGTISPGRAATVKCPRYSVVVKGIKPLPFAPGYTFSQEFELHKVGGGTGYGGRWKVVRMVQENTYPHRTDSPPLGPLTIPAQPQFGGGMSTHCVAQTHGNKVTNICTGGNLSFQVTGNRMGPAGHPIGKISGKTLTMRFDPKNPAEPDMVGTIQENPGGKLNFTILQPASGEKMVYSQGQPAELTLNLEAKVTPATYANQIEWELPEIAGSQRTVEPADAKGAHLKVRYRGLPGDNNSFGNKSVTARVDAGSCRAEDSMEFSVYFPRDASNHPGGAKTPNWFYYWSQTKAKVGPARFGGTQGRCSSGGDFGGGKLMGYYRYQIQDKGYYICDLNNFGPAFSFQSVKWVGTLPDNRKVDGIDTFAVVSRHENGHYEHFSKWWQGHHTKNKFQDTNRNTIKDSSEQQLDKDGDWVPDSREPAYGMDPHKKETLGAGVSDEELICWKEEAAWVPGSADREDWAKPGKQWK